ncbi:PQQ-binding-like beta-propeller repeat protein [Nocardia sp. XZ_19_385]|uniref:outer membrane protein assembly factor BamB family protein n=1 Tax=Nocardia sp. XZ_19_385 TaxID=2769488 RepID=UPI00188F21F8|nr:PQQ-binding-like beta-propeller repeat protein [Nocardia sp. XZ_19_385]
MRSIPGLRNLVLAAAAAVITSAGAVLVLLQPPDTTRKITGTADSAPGLAWSVDAAAMSGRAGAEFRDPVAGTEYDFGGGPGFVDAGATLVTVLGVSDDNMPLRDPVLVGIDAETGAQRWQAAAPDLSGCGAAPVAGRLVCFDADSALVGYDIDTGNITRTQTDWYIFAIATDADRVYIAEGDVESDDVRVHAGTVDDPDAHWSRAFDMGASWEDLPGDALDVSHGQGVFSLGGDLAGFDLASGRATWSADVVGCSDATPTNGGLIERTRSECDGNGLTGTDLIDNTGRIIATTNSAAAHNILIDLPADETIPVLLGDSAYDRRTGTLMWTNPELLATQEADEHNVASVIGTATAIIGDVALLRDTAAHTATGLDMRTGERLWRIEATRFETVHGGDEHAAVFSDYTGLWAIDPRTGATIWDIPFLAVNDKPDAITGDGELAFQGNGRYTYASARTMIGLRPLD